MACGHARILRVPGHQGLFYQGLWFGPSSKRLNTLGSVRRREFGLICISSESCLGSNVWFARLLRFAALRSTLSAKAAPGELLRLCPGSARRETGRCSRGFRVPKDLCRLERGVGFVRLKACRAPRIRPSRIRPSEY